MTWVPTNGPSVGVQEAPTLQPFPCLPGRSRLCRAILVGTSFGLSVVVLRGKASYKGDLPALEDGREHIREACLANTIFVGFLAY